LINIKKYQDNY